VTAPARSATAARLHGLFVLADDDPRWPHDPVAQARAACAGGAAVVQLRAKRAGDRDALAWADAIRELTRRAGVLFFVNDRFDLALAAGADGVHLGQQDLPPAAIPATLRERLLVGRSTHTPAELRAARDEPVDYVAFGPIFGTHSKESEHEPRGLEMLAAAVREAAPRPLIAIGGIGADNAASVMSAGAAGIAVISAVAGALEPEAATRSLVRAISAAAPR
jgi:thiamine-phosphate pyrophosphorylase